MPHLRAMSNEHPHHEYYWIGGAVATLLALWLLGNVILPFVVGAAIAYFLDPLADRLERLGLSRVLATTTIMLSAAVAFLAILLLIIPMAIMQGGELIDALPDLVASARSFLETNAPAVFDAASPTRQALDGLAGTLQAKSGDLVQGVLASVNSVIGVTVFLVIAPVVAFYLLLDWDRMIAKIDDLLPRRDAAVIRQLAREINAVLAGFVRGQLSVCLILGTFYAAALMLAGLNFGLVVGLIAGLLTFIPYVGSITGGVLSIGLALFQFWDDPWRIVVVAAIFVAGQMVEGNVLTPKLVGYSVGLHPVWLLLALSVFGSLFGFVGMLVAVPVAAVIGVLVRHAIERYREGRFYGGGKGGDAV